MTREKKELFKKIEEIENFIAADEELGCGFAPADFYKPLEKEIYILQQRLATLSHFETVDAWMYDHRPNGLPFN